ncbi:MAG: exosortase/archaeosortase family protein [candidate division Zixibacteria bacterium]|nr:exosortase/archaeosortase family protein [candidate division Zixibacteria bacterium]MDH3938321.1 exosortase/archaeosortase family protein [candidate division Zixibacteria bacterium]MDH4033675.1 exosortase/archaeosortase family protein [candidate division Zixibacteria bacterium]
MNAVKTNSGTTPRGWWLPFAALALIYLPALIDLVVNWYEDANYSHGFLIPFMSGYLLYRKRQLLAANVGRIDASGLWLVAAGMFLFIVANGAAEYFTIRFSLVVTLFGLVYFLFGSKMIRCCWFELAFLVFMIPIPYVIYYSATLPMQLAASKITVATLNLLGAGAVRQGNIIHLGGITLEVAEACSGIRSLVSLAALGAIYAYLTLKHNGARTLLFISTAPVAIIANVARVFVSAVLAYGASVDVTVEPTHSIMGLIVFVVAFILLALIAGLLRRIFE